MPEQVHLHEKHTPFKQDQFSIRVDYMGKWEHIQQKDISLVAESTWYCYTLKCGHQVYSKVRIRVGNDYGFREHYIRCSVEKHEPLQWQAITKMEAVTNEHVSNVRSGNAFILPNRILRVDGHTRDHRVHPSGDPFPYVPKSSDRQYW